MPRLIIPAVENSKFNERSRPFTSSIESLVGPAVADYLTHLFGRETGKKGRS
jgi:hypothetical protein